VYTVHCTPPPHKKIIQNCLDLWKKVCRVLILKIFSLNFEMGSYYLKAKINFLLRPQ